MAQDEKLFVCHKNGWIVNFQPRNAAGWRALAFWLLSLVPPAGLFMLGSSGKPNNVQAVAFLLLYLVSLVVWAWLFMKWMFARSEIVDLRQQGDGTARINRRPGVKR